MSNNVSVEALSYLAELEDEEDESGSIELSHPRWELLQELSDASYLYIAIADNELNHAVVSVS
ncbi:hypothetical protein ACTQV1_07260 [Paratractidigestivibacter faecalis]|uniref:hypothetical protein n=1 Tax=Paratractidigestivibacter faecalis TaxID=2292441 RepID=UPI003F9D992C